MAKIKTAEIKTPQKLIEVALPLDEINAAAAREKSIRHGHPSTLHLWWARRPLAAAQAVIFAQFVNNPGYKLRFGEKEAEIKREKLFAIIRDLVRLKNTNNEEVFGREKRCARAGAKHAISTASIRRPRSYLTRTNCPPSTTRLPEAAPCRSKRSGWEAMPAT